MNKCTPLYRTHVTESIKVLGMIYGTATCEVDRSGWLTSFMESINKTYPHRDHLLINNGVPGESGGWDIS